MEQPKCPLTSNCRHAGRCYHSMMDDILFLALAEDAIEYVDERFGRAAAWLVGLLMLALPVALLVVTIWWLAG